MKSFLKKMVQPFLGLGHFFLPLKIRQPLAIWTGRQTWLPGYSWLAMRIVRDLADSDPNAYSRFLWKNHIGFAVDFENANDFGPENLIETRVMLFDHMCEYLKSKDVDVLTEIRSVFEAGCSSGFLLRYLEERVFTGATVFEGVDIDERAVERGALYLSQQGSNIRITCADLTEIDNVMGDKKYDVLLCAGVLRYLKQVDAASVVRSLLHHAEKLVVIAGCAHPDTDNALIDDSLLQEDGTLIHNIDTMVRDAGGVIHFRRWEGDRLFNGYSVYFIFCSLAA